MGLFDWLFSFSRRYRRLRGGYWEHWVANNMQNAWWFRNGRYTERGTTPAGYKWCEQVDDFRKGEH